MAYEAQMIALAKGAMKLHGDLQEVLFLNNVNILNKDSILVFSDETSLPVAYRFHGYDIRGEKYAFAVAAQLGGTDPFSLLTFGYSGTGPECYAVFLKTAGFTDPDVTEVSAPLRLTRDGRRIDGATRRAQWTAEISAGSLDEARKKIEPPLSAESCVLREEVLGHGSSATLVVTVHTASASDAEIKARTKLPPLSEVVSVDIADKKSWLSKKIRAFSEAEAMENARANISQKEFAGETLSGVTRTREVRQGFLGMGKAAGEWEAKYELPQKEVTIRYAVPVKLKIHYGPKKLLCDTCGSAMSTASEGVSLAGTNLSAKTPLLKLRCEKCDITRVEKRAEIEGEWISWQDGTTTPL